MQQIGALPPSSWLFFGLLAASIVGLVAAPWPLVAKFHAVVHGLCAQRPSHSFALGGTNLPFDARMTGIYGGTLTTILFLLARGRWRAMRLPSPGIIAVLVLFVVAMGLDGINSTLQDFQLPYAFEPNNYLRLGTGLLLGVPLCTAYCARQVAAVRARLAASSSQERTRILLPLRDEPGRGPGVPARRLHVRSL